MTERTTDKIRKQIELADGRIAKSEFEIAELRRELQDAEELLIERELRKAELVEDLRRARSRDEAAAKSRGYALQRQLGKRFDPRRCEIIGGLWEGEQGTLIDTTNAGFRGIEAHILTDDNERITVNLGHVEI